MRADVVDLLICPNCGEALASDGRVLACGLGHRFDLARQGYVNLLTGGGGPGTADSAAMVAARVRFLAAGHFAPLLHAVAAVARDAETGARAGAGAGAADAPKVVVDVGAGPGSYLTEVLDALPGHVGVALDLSTYAARRAARCHERAGAAVCDTWSGIPVRGGAAHIVLDVFAPRNGAEMARILRPDGVAVVVTPRDHHLAELRHTIGLLDVAVDKRRRVDDALGPHLVRAADTQVEFAMRLEHADVAALVAMSPSAHHVDAGTVAERVGHLPEPTTVTAAVVVSTFRRSNVTPDRRDR